MARPPVPPPASRLTPLPPQFATAAGNLRDFQNAEEQGEDIESLAAMHVGMLFKWMRAVVEEVERSGVPAAETVLIYNEITFPIARLVAAHLPGTRAAIFFISPVHPTLEEAPMRLCEGPVAAVWPWLPKAVRWLVVAKTMMEAGLWVRPWLASHRVGAGLEPDDDECLVPEDALRLHLLPPLLHCMCRAAPGSPCWF